MGDYAERIGTQKVQELLNLETATEGWEDLGVKDDVHSYRKQTETGLFYIKGVGDMNFPGETIFTLVRDHSRKKQWDQMFMDGRNVHEFNDHIRLVYELYSAPWPVTNRDFLYINYVQRLPDAIVSSVFSVEHPSVPPVKNAVRAHTEIGGFVIRDLGQGRTRVTYTLFMDPRGSIPQMVVNSTQKKQTQNVSKIRAYLTKSS